MTVAASPASNPATAPAATRTRVAIAGATGYAGQELVRILARHPAVTLTAAMSSGATSAPRPLPALNRIWEGTVTPLDVDQLVASADVVFLALPEAASAELAPKLLERGVRVIDLSGAFRIRGAEDRQRWYPATAALPDGTVYGFDGSSRGPAGRWLVSSTATVTADPSNSNRTDGLLSVCCSTFSTNAVTTTLVTGISSACPQSVSHPATSSRVRPKLAKSAGNSARPLRRGAGDSVLAAASIAA